MKIHSRIIVVAGITAALILDAGTLNAQAGAGSSVLATSVDVKNVTLVFTTFRTPVTVACSFAACENLGVFLTPSLLNITCSQPAGATCTFYLNLQTQASVTANDSGIFQFLVDGVAPRPGPTDIHGFFVWDTADPNSTVMQARSYAVVARVTNSRANQAHGVEAEFGCIDLTGDGCSATMGATSMSIGLFTP